MSARFLTVAAGAAALATWASVADAGIITNGSFEQGYANWTLTTGANAANPGAGPALIPTDGMTAGQFGDKVISDNAPLSKYPDADKSGKQAAYFVDDVARETISQAVNIATAGVYEVGFDLLTTTSGSKNQYDSSFSATAAGVTIVQANVSTFGVNTWTHFAANANLSAGTYQFTFVFDGGPAPAKDIVVDNVYVIASSGPGVNVPLPEPASFAVLGAMLLGTGLMRRRAR